MLDVYLKVKFRAFGITFWTFEQTWHQILPVPVPSGLSKPILAFSDRGITLTITLRSVTG